MQIVRETGKKISLALVFFDDGIGLEIGELRIPLTFINEKSKLYENPNNRKEASIERNESTSN